MAQNEDIMVDCWDATNTQEIAPDIVMRKVEEFFDAEYWQSPFGWRHRNESYLFVPLHGSTRIVGTSHSDTNTGSDRTAVIKVITWNQMLMRMGDRDSKLRDKLRNTIEFSDSLL